MLTETQKAKRYDEFCGAWLDLRSNAGLVDGILKIDKRNIGRFLNRCGKIFEDRGQVKKVVEKQGILDG